MSEDKENLILEHSHDGIQEYDNPMPSWWLWTFLGTIIFGFHYWIYYETGAGMTLKDELAKDLTVIQSLKQSTPPTDDNEDELKKLKQSAAVVGQGKAIFAAKCSACHGQELEGIIGPNLTDNYWIHGQGSLKDIAKVVRSGVLDKGMPAWQEQLKNEEIQAVVVFVASRHGSQPKNPKAPQGEKVAN